MQTFEIDASAEETQQAMRRGLEEHHALLVVADESHAAHLNEDVEVIVLGAGGVEVVRVTGRLVQVMPNGTGVVMLEEYPQLLVLGAEFHAPPPPGATADGGDEATELDDDGDLDPELYAENDDGADDEKDLSKRVDRQTPLWAKIAEMSKPEKMRLAKKGNADARRLLLKDRDASLHPLVLSNPNLTFKELASFIRNKVASPTLIKRVLERSDYMSNLSIIEALVFNPHTPTQEAVKLVPKISFEAARRITKAQNLRAPIVRAARLRVHRKGK